MVPIFPYLVKYSLIFLIICFVILYVPYASSKLKKVSLQGLIKNIKTNYSDSGP